MTSARIPSLLLRPALPAVLAAAAALALSPLPAAGGGASTVLWSAPTHADHFRAVVNTGAHVTLRLRKAADHDPGRDRQHRRDPRAPAPRRTVHRLRQDGDCEGRLGADRGRRLHHRLRRLGRARLGAVADVHDPRRREAVRPHERRRSPTGAGAEAESSTRSAPRSRPRTRHDARPVTSDATQNLVLILDGVDLDARPGTTSGCRSCRTTRPAGCRGARSATLRRSTRTSTSTARVDARR